MLRAQSAPKSEVGSIKRCGEAADDKAAKSGIRGGGVSPETLRLDCTTVLALVEKAYVLFASGHVNPRSHIPVEGGPAWIRSERYQVDAKTDTGTSQGMMNGPMLQALLEERFQLKIHRESREVPAYAVTVAKGGLRLRRFQEGSCTPLDLKIFEQFPPPPLPELPAGQKYCGGIDPNDGSRWVGALTSRKGTSVTVEARAMTIDEFAKVSLTSLLERPVVNKTGITERFDFHLQYEADEGTPDYAVLPAMQRQLGLRLEPAKTPGEFLVVDRVSRPSQN
jgi:uncharacterized protein (TIGR03435 family)